MFKLGKKRDNKIVIFIHGLENKPPRKLLKKWCLKSIEEGFQRIGLEVKPFDFELVYWADLLYSKPLDPLIKDIEHPLFLDEPYIPASPENFKNKTYRIKRRLFDRFEKFIDGFFLSKNSYINVEYIFDWVASRIFKDLHAYYRRNVKVDKKSEDAAKKIIRQRLVKTLQKHKGKEILLIAHSMGSIVTYDVLTFLVPEIQIHSLVTIGSPLGLPMIKREIFKEFDIDYDYETKLPTPENILKYWCNIADLDDNVAINYSLVDDFEANSNQVKPVDKLTINDYFFLGKRNPHKSFGYLRTRELTKLLHSFLNDEEPGFFSEIIDKWKDMLGIDDDD